MIAVFGVSPESCHRAVLHVRRGAPDVPVWLYCLTAPLPETAVLCERIHVHPRGLRLFAAAQRELWRVWVPLSVGTWTGEDGSWALKLAPLMVPPFRSVFLNCNGDFLAGSHVARHCGWQLRRAAHRSYDGLSDTIVRAVDVMSACTLTAAAHVLRRLSNPHRAIFARMHGSESLDVAPHGPSSAGDVVRYRQHGSAWNGDTVEALARSSKARWLLWHDNGDVEVTDQMTAPFLEDSAFAVSLQQHYRAWKPLLLPTAPFRAIQPGAATQVLAPLSHAILVDREKLLALRIPKRGLAGTAWLILFWQAAAAGWRSYSTGQAGEIGEQPDFPIVETAFFLRLLWDRQLRRLAPSEPDLSRGTIAFTPGMSEGRGGVAKPRRSYGPRPKVLVVSPFLPYPLSHGGAVRIYNLCRALSGRVDFALAAIREKHDVVNYSKLHDVFQEVYVVDIDEFPSRDPGLPSQVRHHQSRSLRALIARIAEEWRPDLLQVEYTHMAAFRDSAPQVPAILVEHDLTFTLYRQLADKQRTPETRREFELWHDFERQWLQEYDGVWTVSNDDRQTAIEEGSEARKTFAIPNGVDTDRYRPCDGDGNEIFFVGSFRHLPNLLAFEYMRRTVMPLVWRTLPEARLRVVAGPRHDEFWLAPGQLDRRITVHGFVEDLRPLYAKAAVVVAPLEISAGTNIKVLEAMACAKPVVSTPVGCAGLGLKHGFDALIHTAWPEFAQAVASLLSDAGARQRIGANARSTAELKFGWTAIADHAYESYLRTASLLYHDHRAAG